MIRRCLPLLCFFFTLSLAAPLPAAVKKTSGKPSPASVPASAKKKAPPAEVYAVDPSGSAPQVRSSSAILVDANSGEILMAINADQQRPVASTQKLLTALLV